VKGRHGSRGWPAHGTEARVDRRRRRVRAARGGNQREERERLTGGPGFGFLFSFLFFLLGCDRVKEDRGGNVMGTTWLADEDGGWVLRGVRCSERGEGRVARNVRMWAQYSPECGGVGAVVSRSIYGLVILVF
jgi:hypothetical protein